MSIIVPYHPSSSTIRHPRAGFERIPKDLSRTELIRYFTYTERDKQEITQCRGADNQIGFALLLAGVRLTGRFPYDFAVIPRSVMRHVCEQLHLDPPLLLAYPQRRQTRHHHIQHIRRYLGLDIFTQAHHQLVMKHVENRVRTGARPHELLTSTEQMLRRHHLVLPGVTVLEKLISSARVQAETTLYAELSDRIDASTKDKILALLVVPPGQRITPLQQLKQAAGRPSPKALEQELTSLATVRSILPDLLNLTDVHPHVLDRCAKIVSGVPIQSLLRFSEPKRLGLLLCWLWQLRTAVIDVVLTMGNDLIAGVLRRAKNAFERQRQRQHKRMGQVLNMCGELVMLVLDSTISDTQLRAEIFQRWSAQTLHALSAECQELTYPPDFVYVRELEKRYPYVRQFAPQLLETFVLQAIDPKDSLLHAVTWLQDINQQHRRDLGTDAPVDFVPASWKNQVCPEPGKINRALWEICLLNQLRFALKSGNIHVSHSRAFQPIETYLLDREVWGREKVQLCEADHLPLERTKHWSTLTQLFQDTLHALDTTYPETPQLEIRDNRFHVARLERLPIPESAQEVKRRIRHMIQRRHLSDLLLDTHVWTGFLEAFTRLTSGRPITEADIREQMTLLACLIAEGCNIGLSDMVLACPGLTYDQLERVYAQYIREETLAQATVRLINFHLRQDVTEIWGQGRTSSSDARFYGVPVRAFNATFHPKYFARTGRGIGVYTHVSDVWMPFYTQVITCHVRQATYILDGLLYHATRLTPQEHYTDTHGYTELIFALCHLLSIRFAPRIKDLPEQRLWRLEDGIVYQHIDSIFAGQVNPTVIHTCWDEMLRLAASITQGQVRASLIISKLAAASRRNKLYRGLQELGRLLKTAYIAEYVRNEALRRRVLLGLNKGESLEALANRVFFGEQGQMRDRTYEEQLNTASCLNLLLAVIVVWNTVHIQACLRRLRADGYVIHDKDVRFLSPLMSRHIGLYGQYQFDSRRLDSVPSPEHLTY
jgi:TnpA family transposase